MIKVSKFVNFHRVVCQLVRCNMEVVLLLQLKDGQTPGNLVKVLLIVEAPEF